jgi:hypothetical protein
MEQMLTDAHASSGADYAILQQIESFLRLSEAMRIFSSDCLSLRDFAGRKLLHGQQDSNPLVIQGHAGFGTKQLLSHLRDHWRLLTPVSELGFRSELDDFLQVYRRQVSHGLLVIHDADQLPIETQAALMHLLYAQEQNGTVLQVALLADNDLSARLQLFRPEGVAETRLSTRDPLFTQWVVAQAAQEQADQEPVPADIVDLAHNFSKGNPDDMRWIVDRWYAAADYAKRDDRECILDTAKGVEPAVVQLGKSRFNFWNSRQAAISGFLLVALAVGVATHDMHPTHSSNYRVAHQVAKTTYTLQALDTLDRLEALHWVAHHPGLQGSHVVSDRDRAGQSHYHVEFGRFATKKEASNALKQLHDDAVHLHHVA